ncbi:hypothetical protein QL285_016352 [Trifolium repens]|nr:hypothetical protein QL285_016352 [Trifolium repens]
MSSSASDMIPPTTKNVKLGISKNKDRLSDLPDCKLSGSNVSSLKHVDIEVKLKQYHEKSPLLLYKWLRVFANIKSLTVSATTLQVLALIPNLSTISPPSLRILKSFKVKMEDISIVCRITLMDVKLQNAESKKERKRLRKKFKEEESDSLIPDGIVDFLLQNSPSVQVEYMVCSFLPSLFQTFSFPKSFLSLVEPCNLSDNAFHRFYSSLHHSKLTTGQTHSRSSVSSLKHVDILLEVKINQFHEKSPLLLYRWLQEFANIKSLTASATTLQVLSLIPNLSKISPLSWRNLKSLKVKMEDIRIGSEVEFIDCSELPLRASDL